MDTIDGRRDGAAPRGAALRAASGGAPSNASGAPCGWHSRGYLPHFDGDEIMQMVTYRLADSFPRQMLDAWSDELARLPEREAMAERRKRIETYLDKGVGSAWLRDVRIARLVQDSLLYFDGDRYRLHAWVIMPNHVHALVTPMHSYDLPSIVHAWKSFTARAANHLLGRRGDFWYRDYYDRYIRDDRHYTAAMAYIEANPVRARLCAEPEEWPFSSAPHRR